VKAITRSKYGGPEVLEIKELPKPKIKEDEVLIRVKCTTVNRTDCGILTGKPYAMRLFVGLLKPSSEIPGTDSDFVIGDRVWGFHDEGLASHAQYMVIRHDKAIAKIPDGHSFAQAVSFAEGAHYAYNSIRIVDLKAGDKVLVNGATGAIGSSAIQILKSMDLYVTAVGNTKNMDLVKSLGADKLYNYETEDFTTDEESYKLVSDAVGKSSFGKCKRLLSDKGVYISSELGPNAENIWQPLFNAFRNKKLKFPIPKDCKRSVLYINDLVSRGQFKAVIDREYNMTDIKQAYEYVASGQKTGNVIINY